jgi:hypothetical protein
MERIMKHALYGSLSVCWVLGTAQADYISEVLSDNPVVYYRFEESSGTTTVNAGSLGATHHATFNGRKKPPSRSACGRGRPAM